MSQVHPQEKHHPRSHGQCDAQDQPQNGDQPQALLQSNCQGSFNIDAGNFTCFSNLPLELQRKIWEIAAVPQSRIIEIETICERDAEGKIHPNHDDDELVHWSPTKCSPTPLLGICRESRSIAMKYHKYSSFLDRPLFYNTDLDTLWVRGNPLFQSITNDPPSETTLEVLFWQRRFTELGPYLFRSVALDFAGIKEHHNIMSRGNIPQDPSLCTLYAVSRTEVEKIYIVYSSGDCRDEVDQEVKYLVENIKWSARYSREWIQEMLKERNERDGTNLTKWKMPTVEAILDTRLINPKFAAIPHYRAIQVETKYEGIKVESNGDRKGVWRKQVASPCYPNALFETCRESREIAITKYDHSKVHTISTQVTAECNIPRRFYYNVDNDILWMRGDPLRMTTSAEVLRGTLDKAHHEQFSNIAIDVETLFEANFPQDPAHAWPARFFDPTQFFVGMPFFQNLAVKKVYLVYSRVDRMYVATETFEDLIIFMNSDEQEKREMYHSRLVLDGIKGRLWTWPTIEVVSESDLFEHKRDWRGNIVLR
ncbi:uncharacterized protein EAE97_008992 [Botrytis byssoidea]|uniref:2EXR domain-containing protein n=1 Tax=Botrytis byssoidea TaxID=139641 RepID=A0A9P5M0H9_9HELO|nr:uncharacterized protein EAE97_008992 [Botrytis byssoidea]KAF7931971.1 hypothetical protein EAE97_008992 [Botrytis byssoidea]